MNAPVYNRHSDTSVDHRVPSARLDFRDDQALARSLRRVNAAAHGRKVPVTTFNSAI